MKKNMKVFGIIPAHLGSIRFKRKILHNILGLPMIEHVRRRAVKSQLLDEVFIASGDDEIIEIVSRNGGKVIQTFDYHQNGTSRVAESIAQKDCSHVLIIQGDEPLIQYDHILRMKEAIYKNPEIDAWNSTSKIIHENDLFEKNVVKAAVSEENRILYCFRNSPSFCEIKNQLEYIKKIQGLISFKKDALLKLASLQPTKCEVIESIEQLRIISNGLSFFSVNQKNQVPSINEEKDLNDLYNYLKNNQYEFDITNEILENKY